jgi:L-erythro-3,5-diaminohexanoate dehydrogenase
MEKERHTTSSVREKEKEKEKDLRDSYGFHRVLSPSGTSPQSCDVVDSSPHLLSPSEALLSVSLLNVDSTSMAQIRAECGGDEGKMKMKIREIVSKRGKMHNPITNSGGVLIGRVTILGSANTSFRSGSGKGKEGDLIIPLCSLSAIPLHLTHIGSIHGEQVRPLSLSLSLSHSHSHSHSLTHPLSLFPF